MLRRLLIVRWQSRVVTIAGVAVCGYVAVLSCIALAEAQERSCYVPLPWGYIECGNNEVSIVSTVDDPPAVRLVAVFPNGSSKVSFNVRRPDGRQEELALWQGKLDERYRHDPAALAGELTWHVRRPYSDGDAAMVLAETMTSDRVVFHLPVYLSREAHRLAGADRPGGSP